MTAGDRRRPSDAGYKEVATSAVPKRRAGRVLPILDGVLPIDQARVPNDLIAGATLAALAIPEVMGYTKIAGTPVITGLYTILVPIAVFALFGSSRHLVVGADSATAAILATGVVATGAVAGSPEYVALASLCALMCAVALVVARLLNLGFIANFLSRSVLIGFLTGVGIQVAMGQVGGMFGVSEGSGGTIEKFVNALQAIPTSTQGATLAVSVAVLVVIVGLERVNKKIPGALIAVVGAIAASYFLDLASRGVTTLGTVPGGLPNFGLPPGVMTLDNVEVLTPTVFAMFIVILAQSAATSRAYAMRYGDRFDENVDLVGLGLANAAAGLSGTFVVNGSPTKTEMVDSAGGRSQLAQLTTGGIVLIVLLFLTGPLSYMPNAVLAAVVFLIGVKLIDIRGMQDIARLRPGEFAVALATAATVVIVGVEQGIILAIVLSIVVHLSHSYRPYDTLLRLSEDGHIHSTPPSQGTQLAPGLVVYRFGASLYYANATRFTAEIMEIVESADPTLRWFAVAASAIGDIDYSGADSLRSVHGELADRGITLVLLDVDPQVRTQLDRYGLTEKIGAANIFETVGAAAEAYARVTGDHTPADAVEPPATAGPAAGSTPPPDPSTPTSTG
jgi:high affinity sulfate transporter 1